MNLNYCEYSLIWWKSAHQILKSHLRGPVFADWNSAVRADDVKVGLRDDAHAEVIERAGEEASERGSESHGSVATSDADADL